MEVAMQMVAKYRLQQLHQNWAKYQTKAYKKKTGSKIIEVPASQVVYIDPKGVYGKGQLGYIVALGSKNSTQVTAKNGTKILPTNHFIPLATMVNKMDNRKGH